MKYPVLFTALFVGAIALPNPHVPRDDEHNAGLAPVEATSSSSDAVVNAQIMNSKTVCMNLYPKNMHGSKPQNDTKRSFFDYIADQVDGNINCNIDSECSITTDNAENCKDETGDTLSPDLHFIFWNILNLHSWARSRFLAIKDSGKSLASRSSELISTFTNYKAIPADDSDSTIFNIFGSVLALVGPLLAACEPAVGIAGVAAGGSLIAANTVSAAQDTAAEMLNNDLKAVATLEDSMTKITSLSADDIRNVGFQAINEEISTDEAGKYKIADEKSDNKMASAVINQAWRIDKTFIVRAENIRGKPATELKLGHLDDEARVCDKDGTCYFFVISQNLRNTNRSKGRKWSNTKGLDKLEDYGIDKLKLAKDAEWYQKNSNGGPPDAKKLVDLWKTPDGDEVASRYFLNLPVIDYENTKTITNAEMKWPYQERYFGPEGRFLVNVCYYVDSKKNKNWPKSYGKMS
ncbi:hypothetical protein PENSTE_c004G01781 [Penicillium steckii]|uniref:Uncharacterized protein n=1 Tax=Penicillium steckii TaxID=303698 RepID=A0A1V6TMQ3_9EURO|nr:hypothetical protein PENSTE_c004G01781 [Penicillium steckii]